MSTLVALRRANNITLLTPLTERESDILELAALGLTDKAIANALGISDKTVKTMLVHVYSKLGVGVESGGNPRVLATLYAVKAGMIVMG